jgi:hypothetical protein
MPSKSPAQHRLMQAAAHTKGGFGGVPQKVGKEFVKADKKMKVGGVAQSLKKAGFYEEDKSKPERLKIVSQATTKPQRVEIVDKVFAAKKLKDGGDPRLSVSRGEKLPTSQGAGLTKKGRDKFNRATGSNLKAPAPNPKTKADQGRKDSFCARMSGMPGPKRDEKGELTRKAASLKRWNCPGW